MRFDWNLGSDDFNSFAYLGCGFGWRRPPMGAKPDMPRFQNDQVRLASLHRQYYTVFDFLNVGRFLLNIIVPL